MNKLFSPLSRVKFSLASAAMVVMLAGAQAGAQCPLDVVTSGLLRPLGITQSNQGNLLVAESGTAAPGSGRISIVGLDGTRRTLLDGLPSAINEGATPFGPTGLFPRGRTLYVLIGIGDSLLPGRLPVPNPSSPSFETPGDAPDVLADCLSRPTSMTLDEKTGTLYVTDLTAVPSNGHIVSIPVE